MPVSVDKYCSKCVHASRPPAEAPIPTIGNRMAARLDRAGLTLGSDPGWLNGGGLMPGFCVLLAKAELRGSELALGAAGRFAVFAFDRVPDRVSTLDLDWALRISLRPTYLYAPDRNSVFARMCSHGTREVPMNKAIQRARALDGFVWRRVVNLSATPSPQRDFAEGRYGIWIGQMTGFYVCY